MADAPEVMLGGPRDASGPPASGTVAASVPAPAPEAPATTPVAVEKNVRRVYRAGGGRRLTFSFIFLLLLPFFISLGPMLWARITHGYWTGTPGLILIAIGFTVVMFLIVVELLRSIRSRVELGEKAVRLTLPTGRGPTPMIRYKSQEIPYADIAAIETRRECYGGSMAPVLLKGARIIKKDGTPVRLGYVSEANVDPAFPFNEIAERIAARAGVPITDRGTVRRSVRRKMLGLKAMDDDGPAIDQAMVDEMNKRHLRLVLTLIIGLVVLIGIGITMDIISEAAPPRTASAAASGVPAKSGR